jgi:hypothetical protein
MSYEYFLQAHLNCEPQEIPTEKILAIFEKYITEKGDSHIDLEFDQENSCTIYIDTVESAVNGFMVSRPCSGKLVECLYQVMSLGNFVFFEPDGKSPIVLTENAKHHLPGDMIEALGEPSIAGNWDKFLELYENNR